MARRKVPMSVPCSVPRACRVRMPSAGPGRLDADDGLRAGITLVVEELQPVSGGRGTAQAARGDGGARGRHRRKPESLTAQAPHLLPLAPCRAPRTTGDQPWPQAGFGLTTATEPCALVGSTCTNLAPCCHWKMKCAAAVFSPMALNFAGPCTVCTVTPLCR